MNHYQTSEKFEEFLKSVEQGKFPSDPRVPPCSRHDSDTGNILNLARGSFGHVALIRSFAGTMRSNHYHLTDWHFLHLLSGLMHYWWRTKGMDDERPRCVVVEPGQTVFTPPLTDHATFFTIDSTLISISKNERVPQKHDLDTGHVKLVGDKCSISDFLPMLSDVPKSTILKCDNIDGRDRQHPMALMWSRAWNDGAPVFACFNHKNTIYDVLSHWSRMSPSGPGVHSFDIR